MFGSDANLIVSVRSPVGTGMPNTGQRITISDARFSSLCMRESFGGEHILFSHIFGPMPPSRFDRVLGLLVCAKDLFVAAMDGKSPSH